MTKNYKFVLQENMYDCGVAALKTIFLQYGKKINSSDVVRKTASQGTTAYELISSSKKLGLNAKGVKTTLDTLTIKHLPCIAHIIKDKNYFHYIVIFEKNNKNRKEIELSDTLMRAITNFQDNVHATAIEYHRKVRDKQITKSVLDEIKGIGEVKKKELLRNFGSVEKILEATDEEISQIKGINKQMAQKIKKELKKM